MSDIIKSLTENQYHLENADWKSLQLKRIIDNNTLEEIIAASEDNYKVKSSDYYKGYKSERYKDLWKKKQIGKIIFHWGIRRLSFIAKPIFERDGFIVPDTYYKDGAFYYHYELFVKAKSMDEEHDRVYYRAITDLYNFYSDYEWVFEKMADIKSRNLFIDLMTARIVHNPMIYFSLQEKCSTQYFDEDIIKISDEEVFVDVGGFDGDSTLDFIRFCSGKYEKIYFYEPSSKNYMRAEEKLAGFKAITFRNVGVSDKAGILEFDDNLSKSKIEIGGADRICTVKLDEDINQRISFIKADTEGWEMEVLKGAENHIRKDKPKIAISVYHKHSDLRVISKYLISLNPQYKLYLRHYSNNYAESVLYAI